MKANIIAAREKIAEGISEMIEAIITENIGATDMTLLKVPDVARLLAIAEDTVRNMVHRETDPMPVCNIGNSLRFRRSEVMEWAGRQKPTTRTTREEPGAVSPIIRVAPIGVRRASRRS